MTIGGRRCVVVEGLCGGGGDENRRSVNSLRGPHHFGGALFELHQRTDFHNEFQGVVKGAASEPAARRGVLPFDAPLFLLREQTIDVCHGGVELRNRLLAGPDTASTGRWIDYKNLSPRDRNSSRNGVTSSLIARNGRGN